jgi:hypothetical protein
MGVTVPSAVGSYVVSARAYDGQLWGDWVDTTITVAAPPPDSGGNSTVDARWVTLGSQPQTFHDWLGNADPTDYYQLNLQKPSLVRFEFAGIAPTTSLDVRLSYNNSGSLGGYVPSTPLYPQVFVDSSGYSADFNLAAGSYFLQLFGPSNNKNTYYDLTVSTLPQDAGGDYPASPKALGALTSTELTLTDRIGYGSVQDYDDYYTFSLTNDATVHQSYAVNQGADAARAQLFNGAHQIIWDSGLAAYIPASNDFSLAAGDYYLRILSNGEGMQYTLGLSATNT